MAKVDIESEVRAFNLSLKADCYRVTIQVRGKRLSLVATLPPKPQSSRRKPHQQRISLKLSTTQKGFRRAKAKAILLSDQLDRDKFDWSDWLNLPEEEPEVKTCSYWLGKFKDHIWPGLPEDKEFNWTKRFLYFGLNKLPPDQPLTPEVLWAAALTKDASKKAARDRACDRLQQLADFAGVEVDLRPLKVGYSRADVVPKKMPDDETIERTISGISNPQWRYAFALMAVYGLRDHEAYLCTLEDRDGVLVAVVPDGTKTGQHIAYPVPSKWVELWLMGDRTRPQITVKANEVYGARFAEEWRRRKGPETPYALRHAYAIRCHKSGVPIAVAAAWMGHSPKEHLETYQRWIQEAVHREAWEKLQDKSK